MTKRLSLSVKNNGAFTLLEGWSQICVIHELFIHTQTPPSSRDREFKDCHSPFFRFVPFLPFPHLTRAASALALYPSRRTSGP